MKDAVVGIEGKQDLLHVASMYFESLDHMLDVIGMDQSTYYAHLNDRASFMDFDHAAELARVVVLSEPRFRLEDPEDFIKVPEKEGWGTGRIKLDDDFREFIFERRLFDPLNEELVENISGFSRADISNYRSEDRWIPEQGYRDIFDYFKKEFNQIPETSIDIYQRGSDEPYFENVDLRQFAESWIEMNEFPGARNKVQIISKRARKARNEFDQSLGSYLEEWESKNGTHELRRDIIDKVFRAEREISAVNYPESSLDELVEYSILEELSDGRYWIKL